MFQLNRTKKMFLIMIITTLIIPSVALLAITSVYDPPYQDRFKKDLDSHLQHKLDSGEITEEESNRVKEKFSKRDKQKHLLHPHQLTIFGMSIVWLAIGLRQWVVLSNWDKRYKQFKEQQEKIDKQIDDDPKGD